MPYCDPLSMFWLTPAGVSEILGGLEYTPVLPLICLDFLKFWTHPTPPNL